jgi:type VI secretion system Hcp family effector
MNTGSKMFVHLSAIALVTLTLHVTGVPAMAQRAEDTPTVRYVMQIPSTNGNQRIDIFGFSHEIVSPRDPASGARVHSPLKLTKLAGEGVDLLGVMLSGKTLENVVVRSLRLVNGAWVPLLELKLYSVKVTSYSVNGSGLDNAPSPLPLESVAFVYVKIEWHYVNGGVTHHDDWSEE